jgi:hypothetical protein
MAETKGYETHTTTYDNLNAVRRVSWGAVFAGLVIGLAIQLLLGLLGVAIGVSSIDPARGDTPGKGMAIGAGIWLLISGLVSAYVGACVAAYLSGAPRKSERVLHGILAWGVATLVTAFLLTSAVGGLIGGTVRVLGGATQAVAQSGAADEWRGRVEANVDPQRGTAAVGGTGAQGGQDAGTRAEMEQKARAVGETATKAASGAAWWSFAMLLLGLLAAAFGGASERRYEDRRIQEAPAR